MQDRHRQAVDAEVAALESDIRHHVVDLEVAFSTRDWALVGRIYRAVATLADRLEEIDPDARSRALERLEREQDAREAAYAGEASPDDDLDEADAFAGGAPGALTANELLADEFPDEASRGFEWPASVDEAAATNPGTGDGRGSDGHRGIGDRRGVRPGDCDRPSPFDGDDFSPWRLR